MIDTELYDRRPPEGGSPGRRELPVLFHLRDVSRPRVVRPAEAAAPPAVVAEAPPPATSESTPTIIQAPLPAAAPLPALYSLEGLPGSTKLDNVQPLSEPPASLPALSTPATTPIEAPPADSTAASSERAGTESVTAVVRRERRYKTPRAEEWFATHGKFIAAGFVLALIGTIYLARTNRKNVPQASESSHSAPLLSMTETSSATTDGAITIDMPAPTSGAAVAVAKPTSPPEAPHVELQLPVAAQAETSPAATAEKPVSGDSLFVFQPNKRSEERIAARTDVTTASANLPSPPPTSAAAPPSGAPPVAYPVTNSPALYQESPAATSYPRTSAPTLPAPTLPSAMPVAQPPMPAAPAGMSYPANAAPPAMQGAYAPPGGPAPPAWQPPVGAPPVPGPYQSPETIARGPRYERTGSGNY